ncbi:MAG: response regulator [Anaerolineales bacterium]|nr:response regulator [Anaerolineales bacterium]MCB8959130.1 response regulator [Ardenticatenales bacterium]MCB0006199.1 response regulator [Anaerolineales bacterium]MCB0010846.1 response regulator [Anaerolineales bacterium]MCB0017113.1 response regulator [Anaerolineales bacterium]
MSNETILLVEDNPDDLALALRALKKGNVGKKIVVARDGVEAIEYLFPRNGRSSMLETPQLVVLDLKLPKVSGLEVLRQIRADERTRFLPVVILTTSNEQQDIVNCYNNGANSYIRKPVDFDRFYEVIKQVGTYWLGLNESMPKGSLVR